MSLGKQKIQMQGASCIAPVSGDFNGSSSKITFGGNPINGKTNVSYSFWVKPHASSFYGLIMLFNGGSSGKKGVGVRMRSNRILNMIIGNGSTSYHSYAESSSALTVDSWNHVVTTTSQSQTKFYINGSLDVTRSTGTFQTDNSTHAAIGHFPQATQYLNGQLDDIRIYGDILSENEVGYIYNNTTASIPTDNLIAHYKLDCDVTDEQGNFDGINTDVTFVDDPAFT